MRIALLPLAAAAFLGAGAAVVFAATDASDRPSWMVPAVLGSALVLIAVVAYFASSAASKAEADLSRQVQTVRRSTVETHYKVWQILDDLQRELPQEQRWSVPLPNPGASAASTEEALRLLASEARHLRAAAEAVAARGVRPTPPQQQHQQPQLPAKVPQQMVTSGPIDAVDVHSRVGIFVNLARRLQSLVHREIEQLDELENQVEDPDLLKGLFSVDHLATRIRRHAENLAVLGGATSHRQWSRPVNVYEALRSAVAEVEQYARVKLVRPIEGTLKGHAVADIIHLVAELVENATTFSAPGTQVLIRVQRVRTGLAVEVEDRGLGMENHERNRYNTMLATPDRVDLDELLADGRIGLYVVSSLARRHTLTVQLQSNIFGGTQAVLVVPEELLGDDTPPAPKAAPRELPAAPQSMPVRQPGSQTPPQLPSVQLRPLPSAGATPRSMPQPRVDAAPAYTPVSVAVDTGALPVTAEMQAVEAPSFDTPSYDTPSYETPSYDAPPNGYGPDGRPALPKRTKQSHLAPQLREDPALGRRGSEAGHDPGLMAAFQQGQQRADGSPQIPNDSVSSPYRNEEF
ncbi:ATP-binding protein [Glycomyces mayteni]|uniref:histidine kinase n=1 Tax=Glycomyces mayteni TaxID=543887 RepID=A0ABW2DDF0_9ACTN